MEIVLISSIGLGCVEPGFCFARIWPDAEVITARFQLWRIT